jgi:hypothetical protein
MGGRCDAMRCDDDGCLLDEEEMMNQRNGGLYGCCRKIPTLCIFHLFSDLSASLHSIPLSSIVCVCVCVCVCVFYY